MILNNYLTYMSGIQALIPEKTILLLLFRRYFFCHILLRVLDKAPDHQDHNDSDRKRADTADALYIVHGAFREHQRNRQYNQQNAPQQDNQRMGLFFSFQLCRAVARCRICD